MALTLWGGLKRILKVGPPGRGMRVASSSVSGGGLARAALSAAFWSHSLDARMSTEP